MIKLFPFMSKLFSVSNGSSFLSAPVFFAYIGRWIANLGNIFLNWLVSASWSIIKFVLGLMEALEYMINSFIGIKTVTFTNEKTGVTRTELRGTTIQDIVDYAKGVSDGSTTSFVSILARTFKALMGLAIVLLIIFTIIAMVKQEYANATSGSISPEGNDKKPIIKGMFKKMLYVFLLPLTMMFILTGVNSILASFSTAMQGGEHLTVASQVLASSTYDSNKYRYYAQQGKRIPIIIKAYDADAYKPDENDLLIKKIKTSSVQAALKKTASQIVTNTTLDFAESVTYKNNKLTNSTEYGDIYEKFVCTAEQYQVMADFIDYAQKNKISFHVNPIDDANIEWKYVDSAVFNASDVSLKISYRDASDINGNGKTSDSYLIEYSSSFEVTTPISNALESIMALLGVGDYSDYLYKTMERDEDYVNVVQWQNEKVLIKLSDGFSFDDLTTWNRIDQLIIYEYYHFASNNTFQDYTISDLKNGVELDACEIDYRIYYSEANSYSELKTKTCVKINGSYYYTVKDPTQTDKYGNVYYVLENQITETDSNVNFLNNNYATIKKSEEKTAKLKLSSGFNINNPGDWSYTDQIIAYEFYKDLTYKNELYAYNFNDFKAGVDVNVYYIQHFTTDNSSTADTGLNGYYALINGTYYKLNESYELHNPGAGYTFLNSASQFEDTYYYNYIIKLDDGASGTDSYGNKYGISTEADSSVTADKFFVRDLNGNGNQYTCQEDNLDLPDKYNSFSLQLSENFNYEDVDTWTFKDYFIFYLYLNFNQITGNLGIDSLRVSGVRGNIVKDIKKGGSTISGYFYQVKYATGSDSSGSLPLYLYINMDMAMNISEELMNKTLNNQSLLQSNLRGDYVDLFVTVNESNLTNKDTETIVFELSEHFDVSYPASWTVLDYILYSFSQTETIGAISDIKQNGYKSVVYKIAYDNSETPEDETEVLYKFGRHSASKDTYLSLQGVKNLKNIKNEAMSFESVDQFLNCSLLNYVAKYYGITQNQVVTDEYGIIDNLYEELIPYIYDADYIINKIIESNAYSISSSNNLDLYNNVTNVSYKSSASTGDLSTWTNFDAIIYYLTKTTKSSYSGQVITYGNEQYFVYNNYAIKISGSSPLKATISSNNTITSREESIPSGKTQDEYYDENYKRYVSSSLSGNIIKYSTEKFKYSKIEDYITVFELIYKKLTGTTIAKGGSVECDAYSDGTNVYLKIGSSYVLVSTNYGEYITVTIDGNLTLTDSSKIATKDGTYTAFDIDLSTETDFSTKVDGKYNYYTKLDALIYNDLSSNNKTTLDVYKITSNSKKYIYTGKSYVEYTTGNSGKIESFDGITTNFNANDTINKLYSNYYSKYVKSNVSGVSFEDELTTFEYNATGNDITYLSPITIILAKLDIINLSTSVSVTGYIGKSRNSTYFKCSAIVDGKNVDYYIDITDIGEAYYKEDNKSTQFLRDFYNSKYQMILRYVYLKNTTESASSSTSFNSYLNGNFTENSLYYKNYSTRTTSISNLNSFNIKDASTWTLLNILYYNLTGKVASDNKQIIYLDASGKKYLKIQTDSKTYYVKISSESDSTLTAKFTSSDTNYSLKTGDEYSPLGIISYKLLGSETGKIKKITTKGNAISFYFIKDASEKYVNVVYNIPNSAIRSAITKTTYTYSFAGIDKFSEWNLFDIIIALVRNYSVESTVYSNIYIYGENAYILANGRYVNLYKTGVLNTSKVTDIYNNRNNEGTVELKTSSGTGAIEICDNAKILVGSIVSASSAFLGHKTDLPESLEEPKDENDEDPIEESGSIHLNFSEGFKIYDYSTWKLSDYIIYYLFNTHPEYFVDENQTPVREITNFSELVSQGYVEGTAWKYVYEDEFGSTEYKEIYFIGIKQKGSGTVLAVDASIFKLCYSRDLVGISKADAIIQNDLVKLDSISSNPTGVVPGSTSPAYPATDVVDKISLPQNVAMNASDFIYYNYYYYKFNNFSAINKLQNVSSETIRKIKGGSANTSKAINIALSDDFKIADPSTWTWLDFIVVYEFSNSAVRHNFFEGVDFSDLKTENQLPIFEENGEVVIEINGDYYNLLNICNFSYDKTTFSEANVTSIRNSKTLKSGLIDEYNTVGALLSKADDVTYHMRVLYESKEYTVKDTTEFSLNYSKTADSILISRNDIITYRTVNTNVIDNYKVNIKKLNCGDNYSISKIVREVNWPQKLMNDIQVIYPDLNWATLIATDGWLDMLGTFTSAQASGEFVTEGNSANITAVGLVLSEFFVSVTKTYDDEAVAHEYEYTPVFNEDVIQALMLAMLGEEEYNDLSMQGEVFIEMFNNMFIPVLEDIAHERGEELVDGKVDSFYVSVYKAYLATVLLSSDMGEYFYKIATRVYAQYTILDALASASGDYAAYLNYINTSSSESGSSVDAFKYSTFYELCVYENSFTGNSNPTFTFSFEKALKGLYGENLTYSMLSSRFSLSGLTGYNSSDKVSTAHAKELFTNSTSGKSNFDKILSALESKYKTVYSSGSRISDLNTDGLYCFMLDAYYSIVQSLNEKNIKEENYPDYVKQYKLYIDGKLSRWSYCDDVCIDSASGYIPDMQDYIKARDKSVNAAWKAALAIYLPDLENVEFDFDDEDSLWDKFNKLAEQILMTSWTVLDSVFETSVSGSNDVKTAYKNVIDKIGILDKNDIMLIKDIMEASVTGGKYTTYSGKNVDAWEKLLSISEDLDTIISALSEVIKLNPGEYYKDDNGKVLGYRDPEFSDARYTTAYTELLDFKDALNTYISNQKILDIIDKTCITFTLAQFGKNYVTDGYSLSFENKSYTLKSTTSPERLAEYVYGGSFLAKFGVPASYTNSEYNGFIESYRVYDSEDKALKTKLNIWTELRTFASKLANYTARLYYLTNMNDLSENVGDGMLLTNAVNTTSTGDPKTLEHIILEYLISSDLSADTLLRLSFGDTSETLAQLEDSGLGVSDEIYACAYYLEGINYKLDGNGNIVNGTNACPIILVGTKEIEMTSSKKKDAIKLYLNLVANTAYDSNGYYNDGTDSSAERIHKIFKKVISYLIVTEEEGETTSENAVNLDNITYKDFRLILMQALSDYQKNPSETDLENQNRYITLFNLITAQFDYTYGSSTGTAVGTSISNIYLMEENGIMNYKIKGSASNTQPLYASFSTDISTRDIILTLAGVDNRPIEELVGLEYDNLYDRNGNYDEASGDVFILTTYNEVEGKYYPILTRNRKQQLATDDKYYEYVNLFNISFTTTYYANDYVYPIVAKGVIDASGYPTAIKMVDSELIFYRTSLTTSTSVGDEAVSRTRKSSEVTTIGYTKYVDLTYAKPKSTDNMAMFAGSTSMEYAVKANYTAKFIQIEESYRVSDVENFDEIMVLDQFSAFYTLEIKQYFMFLLGFATLIPILFKSSFAVLRRVFDLILLIMAGPVVIATTAINPEVKGKANTKIFDTWKQRLSETLLHVFGYMIAFNIYYILTSTVMNMDFVSDSTMAVLDKVGGLTSLLSRNSINALIRYVYLVAAAGTIETSADLLVNIVTGGKASQAFSTDTSKEVFADVKKAITTARETYDAVTGIANGQALTQLKDLAVQGAKNMIPGGQLVAGAIQKGQDIATGVKAKGLEKSAIANGMSPEVAKKMSKQFADNEKGQRQQKRENSANNANKLLKNTLGIGPIFDESKGKGGKKGGGGKPPKAPKAPKNKKGSKGKGKKK